MNLKAKCIIWGTQQGLLLVLLLCLFCESGYGEEHTTWEVGQIAVITDGSGANARQFKILENRSTANISTQLYLVEELSKSKRQYLIKRFVIPTIKKSVFFEPYDIVNTRLIHVSSKLLKTTQGYVRSILSHPNNLNEKAPQKKINLFIEKVANKFSNWYWVHYLKSDPLPESMIETVSNSFEKVLILPKIEGESLAEILTDPLSSSQRVHIAIGLFVDMAEDLKAFSTFEMFHGDIKPANIIFDNKIKRFRLIDYDGASYPVVFGSTKLQSTQEYNHPFYDKSNVLTDTYALFLVLIEVLTGQRPIVEVTKERKGRFQYDEFLKATNEHLLKALYALEDYQSSHRINSKNVELLSEYLTSTVDLAQFRNDYAQSINSQRKKPGYQIQMHQIYDYILENSTMSSNTNIGSCQFYFSH